MIKEKLLKVRTEKGFSQERMADLLGLHTSNYNRRENGETKIKKTEWEKIASIINVPISEIFESEESNIFKIIAKNNTESQIGNQNVNTNIDEITLNNLNNYIKSLIESNKLKDEKIASLELLITELKS